MSFRSPVSDRMESPVVRTVHDENVADRWGKTVGLPRCPAGRQPPFSEVVFLQVTMAGLAVVFDSDDEGSDKGIELFRATFERLIR
jgi:hypothetical protein